MIIAALTDIHGDLSVLPQVAQELAAADVVVLSGDCTHFGRAAAAAEIINSLRQVNPRVLAVPGNCDRPEVAEFFAREGINLAQAPVTIDGVSFVGLAGSLPCPGPTPGEFSDEELRQYLAEAGLQVEEKNPLVLVTHEPPRDTANDRAFNGRHVGSAAVREFILQRRPLLCCTGHIHEARGIDHLGGTTIVNPGPFRHGGYAWAKLADGTVEVEIRGR